MWNEPTEQQFAELPKLYETEETPIKDKIIHMHLFIFSTDWYIVEYDPATKRAWGFVILSGDYLNAEWGYFSLVELEDVKIFGVQVDRDLHWKVRNASEVDKIVKAQQGRW